jgi:uncharacterized membrane protein (DUF2068 family)
LIIIEKAFLGLLTLVLSAGVLSLVNHDVETVAMWLSQAFNMDADNRFLTLLLDGATNLQVSTIIGISVVGFLYSGLNLVEAYGLHRRYRWAEYLTVAATGMFIPFEIYEVAQEQTLVRVGALVINVLIVYFLAKHKEMFPKRWWG